MDKITQETLLQLSALEQEIKKCEQRLICLEKKRVPMYFHVPLPALRSFQTIYQSIEGMKQILQGKSPSIEG